MNTQFIQSSNSWKGALLKLTGGKINGKQIESCDQRVGGASQGENTCLGGWDIGHVPCPSLTTHTEQCLWAGASSLNSPSFSLWPRWNPRLLSRDPALQSPGGMETYVLSHTSPCHQPGTQTQDTHTWKQNNKQTRNAVGHELATTKHCHH